MFSVVVAMLFVSFPLFFVGFPDFVLGFQRDIKENVGGPNKPFQPVPGRKFDVEFEFEVKRSGFRRPGAKN